MMFQGLTRVMYSERALDRTRQGEQRARGSTLEALRTCRAEPGAV